MPYPTRPTSHATCPMPLVWAGVLCLWLAGGAARAEPPPAHELGTKTVVTQWLVAGPIPKVNDTKTTDPLYWFNKDYLAGRGGEAAGLTTSTTLTYADEDGTTKTLKARRATAGPTGVVDLNARYGTAGARLAYAGATIVAARAQEAQCFLGTGDGVKVWVNGKLVHNRPVGIFESSCVGRQMQFTAALRKGRNAVTIKLDSSKGDWAFVLEVATAAVGARIKAGLEREKLLKEFQNETLAPLRPGAFIFPPGALPRLGWKDPKTVEKLWRGLPLKVRWFDGELNEVATAKRPGRYAAYAEARTTEGLKIRRAQTFYCAAPGDAILSADLTTATVRSPSRPIEQKLWEAHAKDVKDIVGLRFWSKAEAECRSAVMLAGLAELSAGGGPRGPLDTWEQADQEYHLRLKWKILGLKTFKPLAPPRGVEGPPAPVIREGTAREAGMSTATAGKIRALCREWAEGGGEAFTLLVARRGVVVLHEAFSTPKRKVERGTRLGLDSVTKTLTGVFFLRFLDQGLIGLDDPVRKYLPEFKATGTRAITLRQCLMHTSGLEGHAAWGGMGNPWLENVVAGIEPILHPGEAAIYNGMGFDLAGKVMERVTGKNYFRLLREGFLDPLGLEGARITDLAMTAELTAEELARVGQLILNRGRYGRLEYFSRGTFEKLLPRTASEEFPKIPRSDWQYGLGIMWERMADPEAGKGGTPKDRLILGEHVLGHGGMSGTQLRVDLDHELVIALARAGAGKDYDRYLAGLCRAIEEGLK